MRLYSFTQIPLKIDFFILEYKKFVHCKDINSYKSLTSKSKVNIMMFE